MYEDYEFDDNQTYDARPPWLSLIVIIAIVLLSLSWSRFVRAEFRIVDDSHVIPKWKIVTDAPLPLIQNPTAEPSRASTAAPIPSPQTAKELDAEIAKLIKQRDALRAVEKPKAIAGQKSVVFSNHRWVEQGTGRTSDAHLMNVHGFTSDQIRGLTQDQKDRLHGADHEGLTRQVAKQPPGLPIIAKTYARSSNCPNGNCPLQRGR